MSRERELLERLLSNWEHPCSGRFGDLFDEVRELLSTPEQTQDEEPKTHEPWCAYLTQMLMSNPPQRSECNCKNTTAPRPEFVRLSEEEVNSLTYAPLEPYELICAVENRLMEKNRDR